MKAKNRHPWFVFWLLLGLALVSLFLNGSLPVSLEGHEIILGLGVIILLVAAASFLYIRAQQRRADDDGKWLQDDDWSNWGGI